MAVKSLWGKPDAELVSFINDQFDRTIQSYLVNPKYIEEHARHEDTFRTGGYSNRLLSELVQNAADAIASGDERGRIEVILTEDALYCANEGRAWTQEGLVAVTHAYLSDKDGDEIGRFGLGFKSTLSISDHVQVFSKNISFEFNSEKARTAVRNAAKVAKDQIGDLAGLYPILRLPSVIDVQAEVEADPVLKELSKWATTVVKLPALISPGSIAQQVREFRTEFLLFTTRVSSLKIQIDDPLSPLDQEHFCQPGEVDGHFTITTPQGITTRWLVASAFHQPSAEALKDVGTAIARKEIPITYAAPLDDPKKRGEFWAYYPLKDITTASGIFNAPWSVSDDRTTLLEKKKFNEELLEAFAELFVSVLPKLNSAEDPARHFDYMPSRVDETEGEADKMLTTLIPRLASKVKTIPDANGQLELGSEMLPLDLSLDVVPVEWMRRWNTVSNTPKNVPHHSVYLSPTRRTRLRDLFAYEHLQRGADPKKAQALVPVMNFASWISTYADSNSLEQCVDAIRLVQQLRKHDNFKRLTDEARVVPLADGSKVRPIDSHSVFVGGEASAVDIGFSFVDPKLLAFEGMEVSLRELGFQKLDPRNELRALLRRVSELSEESLWAAVWNAVDGLPISEASELIKSHVDSGGVLKVLTQAGTWRDARETYNLGGSGITLPKDRALATREINQNVAASAGVVSGVVKDYPVSKELLFKEYLEWAQTDFANRNRRGSQSRLVTGQFGMDRTAGPFSLLNVLREYQDEDSLARWSSELLRVESERTWVMKNDRGPEENAYPAPHIWAIQQYGLLSTSWGLRRPIQALHPSLNEYAGLLPVAEDAGARRMPLTSELEDISVGIWSEFLEKDWDGGVRPDPHKLTSLVIKSLEQIPLEQTPAFIPALVIDQIVKSQVADVRLSATEDERAYLIEKKIPFIHVESEAQANFLESRLSVHAASTDVSFTIELAGANEPELFTDLYPSFRTVPNAQLKNLKISRCRSIAKRITSVAGVEDNFVEFLLNEGTLLIQDDLPDESVFSLVNRQLSLGLSNQELNELLASDKDQKLERLRAKSIAALTDAERLDLLVGPEVLAKKLPQGLTNSLKAFGNPITDKDLSSLFLDVYGFSALEQLKDEIGEIDPSVPREWAGSSPASAFVKKYGYSSNFAGERAQPIERQFTVQGKPGLQPLHNYQVEIMSKVQEVLTSPRGAAKKAMVELPTGSGKTRVAVESVVRLFLEDKLRGPVLWIAQSEELCEQAVQSWSEVWREYADTRALTIGRLWSNREVSEPVEELSVVIATDAKLNAGSVIGQEQYDWLASCSAVIIDEAHVAGDSAMYTKILSWLGVDGRSNERPLLGLSATPFRGSSAERTKRLTARFGRELITMPGILPGESPISTLQNLKVLSRVKSELLEGTRIELTASEQNDASLWARLSPTVLQRVADDENRTKRLVEHISSLDPEWPVLVFTASVLSAQVVAALLKSRGIPSAAVSGETRKHERRRIIEQFRNGELRVLTNCEVLTEGFDAPNVRALYIAKPTLSPNAYIQMAGRGLRGPLNGGSEECLIVDLEDSIPNLGRDLAYREFVELWNN